MRIAPRDNSPVRRRVMADIMAERLRQVDEEGWTPEHDDAHTGGELAEAAAAYVWGPSSEGTATMLWPESWDKSWFKPTSRRRDLVKAAALLIAEIERLDRAAAKEPA